MEIKALQFTILFFLQYILNKNHDAVNKPENFKRELVEKIAMPKS